MTGFRTFGHGLGIEYAARSMLAFEFYGQAFARWLQEQNTGRPVCYEKVKTGEEQILKDREQRDLDGVPSFLAIRARRMPARSPTTLRDHDACNLLAR